MTTQTTAHRTTYIDVPEAVGVFDKFETLQKAIYDLRMAGFSRADISLLGSKHAMEEKLGSAFWRAEDLEDNPDAPRAAFVSEEAIGELEGAIAGGFFFLGSSIAMAAMLTPLSTLAASIAAIAIGGGPAAVVGTVLARRAGQHHKDYYTDQIRNGGILLWVRTVNAEKEALAVRILKGHSGRDVHVHPWSE
ncbi:hypothetical protein [Poseidonocella sedimentorum]|uniref:Uncharacterized protein n=1 Tax=Poseidonocella sedimentorum TaxID=871652 RepID=A0A1I6DLR4_9RHOB|nr:hypothetical protein [Poseidonocella sedimentorum]SFR06317.1 hypothetical protein SAMN04515673_10472 [Poseidonocella sedimentorum]